MKPWKKNPISTPVSALDVRLSVLDLGVAGAGRYLSFFRGMCRSCCHGLSATWRHTSESETVTDLYHCCV